MSSCDEHGAEDDGSTGDRELECGCTERDGGVGAVVVARAAGGSDRR